MKNGKFTLDIFNKSWRGYILMNTVHYKWNIICSFFLLFENQITSSQTFVIMLVYIDKVVDWDHKGCREKLTILIWFFITLFTLGCLSLKGCHLECAWKRNSSRFLMLGWPLMGSLVASPFLVALVGSFWFVDLSGWLGLVWLDGVVGWFVFISLLRFRHSIRLKLQSLLGWVFALPSVESWHCFFSTLGFRNCSNVEIFLNSDLVLFFGHLFILRLACLLLFV